MSENSKISLENLIKEIIKARGKTNKDVAFGLGINDKTFNGIINRPNAMKADMLLKLSDYLGFDLEWLKNSLGYSENSVQILSEAIPRMPEKLREQDRNKLLEYVDSQLQLYGSNLSFLTEQVYNFFFRNDFYILDLLLPAGEEILVQNIERDRRNPEKRKTRYCCIYKTVSSNSYQRMTLRPQVLTAQELIARTIIERMEAEK